MNALSNDLANLLFAALIGFTLYEFARCSVSPARDRHRARLGHGTTTSPRRVRVPGPVSPQPARAVSKYELIGLGFRHGAPMRFNDQTVARIKEQQH